MKIVVLTTETLHHSYFVRELTKAFPLEAVMVERRLLRAPFATHHPFEEERDAYERGEFFGGQDVSLADFAPVIDVETVNDQAALARLRAIKPEIVVVFGTGKLSPEVIGICPGGMVNLHGGDPEEYRGLDSHLWAIYHGDFGGLVTTLHYVNEILDDGRIILQAPIPIRPGMPLYQLRRYNTGICLTLTLSSIDMYLRHGYFISRPQRRPGRYYSFMPAVLKEICVTRFRKYTEGRR